MVPMYTAPMSGSSPIHAQTFAQGVNVDPNSSNNILNSAFLVGAIHPPTLGQWGVIALALSLFGIVFARRRVRARAVK